MLRAFLHDSVPERVTELALGADESRHLVKSLRAREGESVQALDGRGRRLDCRVALADARALRLAVVADTRSPKPEVTLTLAQCLPKGGTFDDLLRTAVELGADRVIPLHSDRCEVRLDAERAAAKASRWRDIAVEAAKQSGNPWLPQIAPVGTLRKWLAGALPAGHLGLTASLEAGAAPVSAVMPADGLRDITVLVGPEGDLSPEEYAAARAAGFLPVRLGDHVLRSETAALVALVSAAALRARIVSPGSPGA